MHTKAYSLNKILLVLRVSLVSIVLLLSDQQGYSPDPSPFLNLKRARCLLHHLAHKWKCRELGAFRAIPLSFIRLLQYIFSVPQNKEKWPQEER